MQKDEYRALVVNKYSTYESALWVFFFASFLTREPVFLNNHLICDTYLQADIFKYFIYLLLEKGREGEREGEKEPCVFASRTPPTGDLAHNPGMCPDWESNWRPFGSQAGAQSTEPHQPELIFFLNSFHDK